MNEILRQRALADGQQWTRDVAAVTWCPDPQLALQEDRMRLMAERESIRAEFGVEIGKAG